MVSERPPPRKTSLLPLITKKRSSLRKRKVQQGPRQPCPLAGKGERRNDHTDSPPGPEVSEVPSKQKRLRPPRQQKDDAP